MNILYEDKNILIKGRKKDSSDICLLSFTGVGLAMGGVNIQKEEFVSSLLKNGHSIFIIDKSRSWSNNIDIDIVKKTINNFLNGLPNVRLVSIGNSMGASNALFLQEELKIDLVIAFAPQFSVHPDIFPNLENKNWEEYRNAIKNWKYISLENIGNYSGLKYIFHGDSFQEKKHSSKFPKKIRIFSIMKLLMLIML